MSPRRQRGEGYWSACGCSEEADEPDYLCADCRARDREFGERDDNA